MTNNSPAAHQTVRQQGGNGKEGQNHPAAAIKKNTFLVHSAYPSLIKFILPPRFILPIPFRSMFIQLIPLRSMFIQLIPFPPRFILLIPFPSRFIQLIPFPSRFILPIPLLSMFIQLIPFPSRFILLVLPQFSSNSTSDVTFVMNLKSNISPVIL